MRGGGLTNGSVFNIFSHHGDVDDVDDHEHGDADDHEHGDDVDADDDNASSWKRR